MWSWPDRLQPSALCDVIDVHGLWFARRGGAVVVWVGGWVLGMCPWWRSTSGSNRERETEREKESEYAL